MWNDPPVLGRRLVSQEVEAAVNLPRVGADDLRAPLAREMDSDRALPGRRRPDDRCDPPPFIASPVYRFLSPHPIPPQGEGFFRATKEGRPASLLPSRGGPRRGAIHPFTDSPIHPFTEPFHVRLNSRLRSSSVIRTRVGRPCGHVCGCSADSRSASRASISRIVSMSPIRTAG